jgi:hypothetical protein
MLTIAADPKHLGARIGILSVLHTWGCPHDRAGRPTKSIVSSASNSARTITL